MVVYSLKYKKNKKRIKLTHTEEYTEEYDGSTNNYMERRFEFCEEKDIPFLTNYEEIEEIITILNKNKNYKDIDMCMISEDREYKENEFEIVKYELREIKNR